MESEDSGACWLHDLAQLRHMARRGERHSGSGVVRYELDTCRYRWCWRLNERLARGWLSLNGKAQCQATLSPTATDQAPRSMCSEATILKQHESSALPTTHLSDEKLFVFFILIVFSCPVKNVKMFWLNVCCRVHAHALKECPWQPSAEGSRGQVIIVRITYVSQNKSKQWASLRSLLMFFPLKSSCLICIISG